MRYLLCLLILTSLIFSKALFAQTTDQNTEIKDLRWFCFAECIVDSIDLPRSLTTQSLFCYRKCNVAEPYICGRTEVLSKEECITHCNFRECGPCVIRFGGDACDCRS